jgi:hypothetical protein
MADGPGVAGRSRRSIKDFEDSVRKIVEMIRRPEDPVVRDLLERIARGGARISVGGLTGAARPFVTALLARHLHRPLVVVSPTDKEPPAAGTSPSSSAPTRFACCPPGIF